MDRRTFLQHLSIASATLYAAPTIASVQLTKQSEFALDVNQAQIRKAIHTQFGSEFDVTGIEIAGQVVYADIAHLENRYLVTSSNLTEWQILSTTPI